MQGDSFVTIGGGAQWYCSGCGCMGVGGNGVGAVKGQGGFVVVVDGWF